jgi:hypothetical protein
MDDLATIEAAIGSALARDRGALQSEERLQTLVARVLADLGVTVEREKRLDARDRPDFWTPKSGLVIEIKLRRAGLDALRQVARYLRHPEVTSALLIAPRVTEYPPLLGGKPVRVIQLWPFNV